MLRDKTQMRGRIFLLHYLPKILFCMAGKGFGFKFYETHVLGEL
jgi:hypothetical protein